MSNEVNAPRPAKAPSANKDKIIVRSLDFYYGQSKALKNVTLSLFEGQVWAFIQQACCILKRLLHRTHSTIRNVRHQILPDKRQAKELSAYNTLTFCP